MEADQHGYGKNWDPAKHYRDLEIAERYDRERFQSAAGRAFDALEKRHLRHAFRHLPRGSVILDCPAGTGRLSETLLELGHSVQAVDISPAMLEVARRKLARFGDRFVTHVSDAHALAGLGIEADAALCARVLSHLPFPQQVSFLRSVAARARSFVVFTHGLSTTYQRARRTAKRVMGHSAPVVYPVTPVELNHLLSAAGLYEVERFRPSRILTETVIVVARHV